MQDLKDRVIEIATLKLNARDITLEPDIIETVVEETGEYICNYCNVSRVPNELKFCWANMAVDYFTWFSTQIPADEEAENNKQKQNTFLSAIKEGDTQLNFSESSKNQFALNSAGHNMQGVLDSYVLNYKEQLNRFRRIVW